MVSVNEELQSTNEELETSKEELQTVNHELRVGHDAIYLRTTQVIPRVVKQPITPQYKYKEPLYRGCSGSSSPDEWMRASKVRERVTDSRALSISR
jgi:hypothetical protein